MTIWQAAFWRDTFERCLGTAWQAAAAVAAAGATGVLDVDWAAVGSVAALAAFATLGKCIVAVTLDPASGASLGTAVPADAAAVRELGDVRPVGRHSSLNDDKQEGE